MIASVEVVSFWLMMNQDFAEFYAIAIPTNTTVHNYSCLKENGFHF